MYHQPTILGSRCSKRLLPNLLPQLAELCSKTSHDATTHLLRLTPCQACYLRKLTTVAFSSRSCYQHSHRSTWFKTLSFSSSTSSDRTGNVSSSGPKDSNDAENIKVLSSNGEKVEEKVKDRSAVRIGTAPGEQPEQPVLTVPSTAAKTAARMSKRAKIDWSAVYYDNTYVTPIRALNEYMLISADLETLPKYTRRSPFVGVGNMSVYLKTDIEQKAYEVWGGREEFLKEKEKRRLSQEAGDMTATIFKKALKQYRRTTTRKSEYDRPKPYEPDKVASVFKSGTGRVVVYAVCINFANFVLKGCAWLYTGSHSMFAEAIHSAADTFNQVILAIGIHQSIKIPDREHPYGYDNLRYVSSLISGVGIFCIGAGLSWYHGIQGLLHPDAVESLHWAIAILGGSLISEGGTCILAFNQVRAAAQRENTSWFQYVRGGYDPSTNVVLLEDLAAVAGVMVAAGCMTATALTGNVLFDAAGSIVIGCLLGSVASFIIYTNSQALVGRSIPADQTARMCQLLESDRMVRALHDVKATDMGGKFIRFKAEVDFDGKELTRSYLDKVDVESLAKEMQSQNSIEAVEEFMLRHGEKIVDALGMEVDRLEARIRKQNPKVRHVDLEIL